MKIARLILVFVLMMAVLEAVPLASQTRFELGFGWSLIVPDLNSHYANSFSPPFNGFEYASSASQTLNVKGRTASGISGFLNVFFGPKFGLQVLADYSRPKVKGANSAYHVTLNYPPTDPAIVDRTLDWPATAGDF